ncbi:MAG: hypothetical protein JOZ41_02550 [Chloroflexi bacterium]|nr:hypothetical protein [Chloroflexota bacterium]
MRVLTARIEFRMCRFGLALGLIAVLLLPAAPGRSHAQTAVPGVQSLLLGDRTCYDADLACSFPDVIPIHRYLHVILHDTAGFTEWQVRAAPTCAAPPAVLAGGQPIDSTGFREVVADLGAPAAAPVGQASCFILGGSQGHAVTVYAAYFDDNPAPDADLVYPDYESLGGRPDIPDLDVGYIHRDPAYAYDAARNDPAPGDAVTFTAHVINAGGRAAPPFSYVWYLGKSIMSRGAVEDVLAPGEALDIPFHWRWQAGPHTLTFRLRPLSAETSTANNRLSIRTDAIALGLWVERGAYAYFRDHQWLYCQDLPCRGSDSFEDWLQRQVFAWNQLLAGSIYPAVAPAGIADRVRVDKVTIVPDGALPLHGVRATNEPDTRDHGVDLEWGIPAGNVASVYPHVWDGPFDVDWGMIHELNHARSLADLYRFDVGLKDGPNIAVTGADGKPVWSPSDPFNPSNKLPAFMSGQDQPYLYQNREQDLMSCVCTPIYSEYSALVLNRLRGRRARCGNTNPPCNLGDWYGEMPPINLIRVLDPQGAPVADGSVVNLFYDVGSSYSGHRFEQASVRTLRVTRGAVRLGADPFHAGGSTWTAGHNLLLIEVQAGSLDDFCFLEPTPLNMAYWTGYRDSSHPAIYALRLGRTIDNGCNVALPPPLINEPFATSPYRSSVQLGPAENGRRTLTVRLRDDATPPDPMRGRLVEARGTDPRYTAIGTTDVSGTARIALPARAGAFELLDVTDNDLVLAPQAAGSGRKTFGSDVRG